MLIGSHVRLENRFVIPFNSNVVDHYRTIIAANCNKRRVLAVEIKTHYSRISHELVLWMSRILDRIAANQT